MKWPQIAAISALSATAALSAQQPAGGRAIFDVVSIRPSPGSIRLSNTRERPGGGFILEKGTALNVITYAYAIPPDNIEGLPGWASHDVYDITATASAVSPTVDDRRAMVRAMLADRFKLRAHTEMREQPAYDLVKARSDGRLGPSLTPYEVDCAALALAEREATAAGAPRVPSNTTSCTARVTRTGLVGEVPMFLLAGMLRSIVGRPVVDKTGLTGSYRVRMEFDSSTGVQADAAANAGPTIFAALQEQLGLRLEPSRVEAQFLIVDGIEPPTEN